MTINADMIAGIILLMAFIVMIIRAIAPKIPLPLDPQTLAIMAIAVNLIIK